MVFFFSEMIDELCLIFINGPLFRVLGLLIIKSIFKRKLFFFKESFRNRYILFVMEKNSTCLGRSYLGPFLLLLRSLFFMEGKKFTYPANIYLCLIRVKYFWLIRVKYLNSLEQNIFDCGSGGSWDPHTPRLNTWLSLEMVSLAIRQTYTRLCSTLGWVQRWRV